MLIITITLIIIILTNMQAVPTEMIFCTQDENRYKTSAIFVALSENSIKMTIINSVLLPQIRAINCALISNGMPCLIVFNCICGSENNGCCLNSWRCLQCESCPRYIVDWMDASAHPCGLSQTCKTGKVEPVDGKIPSGDTELSLGVHVKYSLIKVLMKNSLSE